MDELYSETTTPARINLEPEQVGIRDENVEIHKMKEKMPKYKLHKHLNSVVTNDMIRKERILQRLKNKLPAKINYE